MTDRHVRASTSRLRLCYKDRPRKTSRKGSVRDRRVLTADPEISPMASAGPGQGDQPAPGGNTLPGGAPADGDGQQADGGAHHIPEPLPSPPLPPQNIADYLKRLHLLEEKFKQREDSDRTRHRSKSTSARSKSMQCTPTRSPRSPPHRRTPSQGGRRRSPSRPRQASRRSSHSRTRSPRRGYSPSSNRSGSRGRHGKDRRDRRSESRRTRSKTPRYRSTPRRSRSRSRPRAHSRRRSRSRSRGRSTRPKISLRSLRNDPAARSDADQALAAQYPLMGSTTGTRLSRSRATLEPYRNLPPDIKKRAGERRSRRDLSLPEHVCGLLFMALKAMDPGTDAYAAVEHTAQVAQDAATMQWPTVLAWSQACLSHLEGSANPSPT